MQFAKNKMKTIHEWPGIWSKVTPQVQDHKLNDELVWVVRGYPFNFPVLAKSSVGVKLIDCTGNGIYQPFVRVEIVADGVYGVQASDYSWYNTLEWLGPIKIPEK